MLTEVNDDLFFLCEEAANEVVSRILEALDKHFSKLPVPASLQEEGQTYLDFIARRAQDCLLENVGDVQARAVGIVKERLAELSKAERFTLAAYVIEMNQKFPEDEEDDSPETNVEVDNHMPTDDELTEYIVGFWEDRLFDMEYEDYDKSADITVTSLKLGDKCPYCGGKLLPIVYGEPDDETFDRHGRGEIVLGGCCVNELSPQKECAHCGFQFLEVEEKD